MLVWPALPLHPHRPGDDESNRTPTTGELRRDAVPQLGQLIEIYKPQHIAAIGNIGQSALAELGIEAVKIRHPARWRPGVSCRAAGTDGECDQTRLKSASQEDLARRVATRNGSDGSYTPARASSARNS